MATLYLTKKFIPEASSETLIEERTANKRFADKTDAILTKHHRSSLFNKWFSLNGKRVTLFKEGSEPTLKTGRNRKAR